MKIVWTPSVQWQTDYNVNLLYCNCQKMALKQDGVHFVIFICRKQGNEIEGVVLNRVAILGFFGPNQGQGFKPSATHLNPNIGWVPPFPL